MMSETVQVVIIFAMVVVVIILGLVVKGEN
jgi:hypothetical protein